MKVYLLIGLVVSFSIGANLLLKTGATNMAQGEVLGFFNFYTVSGLLLFACGGIVYAILLRWVPLNLAQSLMAIQYVGIIFAAAVVLSEPISLLRWLGIALIGAGIFVVTRTS